MKDLPNEPGCYLFKNKDGFIIYVGKAKNIKKRVATYFAKKQFGKTAKLVSEIKDVAYFVVANETEALILELNLIKKYSPKYNILLRDDKSYPYIELTDEKVPKLRIVRRLHKKKENSILFGPYPNVLAARKVVNLLNRIYPLPKCKKMPKTACLYYHIDQCLGFCINNIDQLPIEKIKKEIVNFLNGNYQVVVLKIKNEMKKASSHLDYEKALELKELLNYIETVLEKQKVEIKDLIAIDVFGYYVKDNFLALHIAFIRGGKINHFENHLFEVVDLEISSYISQFYQNRVKPTEILIDYETKTLEDYLNIKVKKPIKGFKKGLIEMANQNAKSYYDQKIKNLTEKEKINLELKNLLNLKKLNRIELFDNSTLFGSYSVSAMVVFEEMAPLKKNYRKFKINEKLDDYDSLKQVIYRRYFRVLFDNLKKPDLIMVDGGIGHVNAAKSVLEQLSLKILVVGIYKNNRHQTEGLIVNNQKIILEKNSQLYRFIVLMQEEVHRFTINYHRQIRSKGSIKSALDDIPLVGLKSKEKLLKQFGSVKMIKTATDEQLLKIINKNALMNLRNKLGSEKSE